MNIQRRIDPATPATYADIEALPDHITGEIIYGALHTQPRPAPKHALAHSRLGGALSDGFDQGENDSDWVILYEPELHIANHVLVPDIAGWRKQRMPILPETAYFETVPDWVCEILSPSTRRIDTTDKRAIYAEIGVTYLWHVDPDAQTLEGFVLRDGQWLLTHMRSGDDICDVPPFDAAPFSLGALWTV